MTYKYIYNNWCSIFNIQAKINMTLTADLKYFAYIIINNIGSHMYNQMPWIKTQER